MSVRDGAHATVGEWIAWATGVGSPKTTEHQRDVPAARRPSGEDKLIGAAAGWGAGAAAFIVAVRAAGHALAVVRIAAHYHIAPVVGALCVAASGALASSAFNIGEASMKMPVSDAFLEELDAVQNRSATENAVRAAGHGVAAAGWFWAVGGRFRSVCHSSLLHPGGWAVTSIPARPFVYATTSEKKLINELGRKHGCHTCGHRPILPRRFGGRSFNADHQPPNKFVQLAGARAAKTTKVRFYPQCTNCSFSQAGTAQSSVTRHGKSLVAASPFALSWAHIWFPHSVFLQKGIEANATSS